MLSATTPHLSFSHFIFTFALHLPPHSTSPFPVEKPRERELEKARTKQKKKERKERRNREVKKKENREKEEEKGGQERKPFQRLFSHFETL
jgi:hypothetical protein